MTEPTTQEHIRGALMALYLVRNKLNSIGLDKNDTAMVNLACAENTLRSIDGVDVRAKSVKFRGQYGPGEAEYNSWVPSGVVSTQEPREKNHG